LGWPNLQRAWFVNAEKRRRAKQAEELASLHQNLAGETAWSREIQEAVVALRRQTALRQ
jgi:hypothetical protein